MRVEFEISRGTMLVESDEVAALTSQYPIGFGTDGEQEVTLWLKSGTQFLLAGVSLAEAKARVWPDEEAKPFQHFVGPRDA